MANEDNDLWEGAERFDVDDQAEWLFVPAGFPRLTGKWRSYLEHCSVELWRRWWESHCHEGCRCCCCPSAEPQAAGGAPAPSNLSINFYVVRLFTILIGGQGRLPYQIDLGWTVGGASGQVEVTLGYGKSASGPFRTVQSFQGASMADYMVQLPGGQYIYGPQTVYFQLTAT